MGMPVDVIAEAAEKAAIEMPGIAPGIGELEPEEEAALIKEAADNEPDPEDDNEPGDDQDTETEGVEEASEETEEEDEASEDSDAGEPGEAAEGEPAQKAGEVAQRLAAIAEAEEEARTTLARLKKRESDLNDYQAKLQEHAKSTGNIVQAFQNDPFGTLEKIGVPFDALLQMVHDNEGAIPKSSAPVQQPAQQDDTPPWAQGLMERLDRIEGKTSQADAAAGEQIYRGQIQAELNKDDYAVLKTMRNAEDVIFNIAMQHAGQTGQMLPVEQIAASLQEEWEEQLEALPNYDATQAILSTPTGKKKKKTPKKPARESGEDEEQQTSLSGDMTPTKKTKKRPPKSREDQIRNAARALEGQNMWGEFGEDDDE